MLDGHTGTITDMSCIEMMLWKWQNARYPMLEHPTEFSSFVLKGHGIFTSKMTPNSDGDPMAHSGTFTVLWHQYDESNWLINRYIDDSNINL